MNTMFWKVAGSVLVIREGKKEPSDLEWREFIDDATAYRKRVDDLRILIVTDGGGPTSAQRGLIKEAVGGKPFRSAVVSDAIKVRFIASAIMLISKNHASFTMREVDRAYEHLGISHSERRVIDDALRDLESELKRAALAG